MASALSIAIRKQEAVQRIKVAAVIIQAATGAESVDVDPQIKDEEIRQATQLEAIADLLTDAAARLAPKRKGKPE